MAGTSALTGQGPVRIAAIRSGELRGAKTVSPRLSGCRLTPAPASGGRLSVTSGQLKAAALPVNRMIGGIPSNYGLITWDGSVLTVS